MSDVDIHYGEKYTLIQFHFHSPSKNKINGKYDPLKGHFVHVNKDGGLLVMAVMFDQGAENTTTEKLMLTNINIAAFLPKEKLLPFLWLIS